MSAALKSGRPIPDAIVNAPELLPTLRLFWDCYFALRRGKTRDLTLSWWEVQYWCSTYGISGDLAQAVQRYTAELDNIWVSLIPKKGKEPEDGLRGRNKRG